MRRRFARSTGPANISFELKRVDDLGHCFVVGSESKGIRRPALINARQTNIPFYRLQVLPTADLHDSGRSDVIRQKLSGEACSKRMDLTDGRPVPFAEWPDDSMTEP